MGRRQNQYLAAFCILALSVSFGGVTGWNAQSFPQLMSNENPVLASGPLTQVEVSWIASLVAPGAIVGVLLYGWIGDKVSKKMCILSIGAQQTICWLLIGTATHYYFIYASRFLHGICSMVFATLGAGFLMEIAEVKIRGYLGALCHLCFNLGIFLSFIAGASFNCLTTPWLFLPLNLVFFSLLVFLPDTPMQFARHGNMEQAEKSLRFYRALPPQVNTPSFLAEMVELKSVSFDHDNAKKYDRDLHVGDFVSKAAIRSISLSIVLTMVTQLSGAFALMNYSTQIFGQFDSGISASNSTIILGSIQVLSASMSAFLIEKTGRKVLLVTSTFGTSFALAVFGSYFLLPTSLDLSAFNWVPLVGLCSVIFMSNLALLGLPYVLMQEIIPIKIRGTVISSCIILMNIASFMVLKILPFAIRDYGFHVPFFTFALSCGLGGLYCAINLVETKGKTLTQIQEELSR